MPPSNSKDKFSERAIDPAVPNERPGSENNYRFIKVLHRGIRAALIMHAIFIGLFLWLQVTPLFLFNIGSVVLYAACVVLLNRGRYELTILLCWIEIVGHAILATALLGFASGFQYYIIVLVPLMFVNAYRSNRQKIILTSLLCLIYLTLDSSLGHAFQTVHIDGTILAVMRDVNIIALFGLLGHLAYLYVETVAFAEARLTQINSNLEKALSEVNTLRGILPLCSFCKKIRDDQGYWNQVDVYFKQHYSDVDFSHGVCPECAEKHYPGFRRRQK